MALTREGWETLTISLRKELKDKFEELFNELGFNSKAEFLTVLLDKIQEETPVITPDKIEAPEQEPIKKDIILAENEILVKLNPVQLLALLQPFEFKDFIKASNLNIEQAIQKKDFWTNNLKYPMFFSLLDPEADQKGNMGTLLVNVFMSAVINNRLNDLVDIKMLQAKGLELIEPEGQEIQTDQDQE